jgi:hypothetical protein
VELARIERMMFDTGVFTDYIHASVPAGAKSFVVSD